MIRTNKAVVPVTISGSGTIAVVAAPAAGKRNCLIGCSITLASLSTLQWKSASTALEGVQVLSALDWDPIPDGEGFLWTRLDCAAAEALNLVVGATATGVAFYVVEDA